MNTESDELAPGTVLQHRYEIQEKAGGGGMGTVYKAIDTHIANRAVAVKEMKQADLVGEDLEKARRLFREEASLLSRLQHDHIPHVYDFFQNQGRHYLVMEWIEGETLQERLRQTTGPLPVLRVLLYAIQLCDALFYLHNCYEPIIFRDLKPSNIMIRGSVYIFLIDFGIARVFKQGQTSDTEIFRVRGYGAPELGYAQTDQRSDLFSLGATMHYCLTRKQPDHFEYNRPFPSIRQFNKSVSADLDALILSMVQQNPDNRPSNVLNVQQQLVQFYQEVAASQGTYIQDASISTILRTPTFYTDETEWGIAPPPPIAPAPPPVVSPLTKLPGLLSNGWGLLARPLAKGAQGLSKVMLSASARQSVYYRYLFIRARLKANGVWTTSFLLLLLAMLVGTLALNAFVYSHLGNSYDRAEFALAFVLLVIAMVAGGYFRNSTARHIMLGMGCFVALAFLLLLISPGFQSGGTGTIEQPATLNLLLTYGVVTLALIAMLGTITSPPGMSGNQAAQGQRSPTSPTSQSWLAFVRLGRVAMAGVAGICLLLQWSFGEQEQMIFAPIQARPFAVTISSSPRITTNTIALVILGFIALYSLVRVSKPLGGFAHFLVLLLYAVFLPAQYTSGLSELSHVFPLALQPTLVLANFAILAVLIILSLLTLFLALFPKPDSMAWMGYIPLLFLSLGVALLQGFLGGQEPFSLLSSSAQNSANGSSSLAHVAAFGQLIIFLLAAAGSLLLLRSIFFRRASSSTRGKATYASTSSLGAAVLRRPARFPGAGDRLALTVVTLGCGIVQWSFWMGVLQHKLAFDYAKQGTALLYASYFGLTFILLALVTTLFAVGFISAHALFFSSQDRPWMRTMLIVLDGITTLCLAGVTLLLLSFFGTRGGWLASSFNAQQTLAGIMSPAPQFAISYSVIAFYLLAGFALIALLRLRRPFGWWERVLVLLCSVITILILTDAPDVQQIPLLSADMQQMAGTLPGLTISRVVAVCILLAALLSLLWLLRGKTIPDRFVLGIIFTIAAICAGIPVFAPHQTLLLLALLAMIQGTLIARRIELVRNGNVA